MRYKRNLYTQLPADRTTEVSEKLWQNQNCCLKRIISDAHTTPSGQWYDQDTDEWVLLLQGAARLAFEDEVIELFAGDYLLIPAHERHRVDWTAQGEVTIWLTLHYKIV